MIVLAVDTTTTVYTVAIIESNTLKAELFFNTRKKHSQRLMPMLDMLLDEVEIRVEDIDCYAVAKGPGSFTGIRIGMSALKALAQVLNKPLVGVPSLDGLSQNVKHFNGLVCPVLNARKNEVYTAIYQGLDPKPLTEYLAAHPEKLVARLKKENQNVIMLGDGVCEYRDFFVESLEERVFFASPENNLPRASQIAFLGLDIYKNSSENHNFNYIEPIYIRKSEAENRLLSTEG